MSPAASAFIVVIFVCYILLAYWTARALLALIMLAMAMRTDSVRDTFREGQGPKPTSAPL